MTLVTCSRKERVKEYVSEKLGKFQVQLPRETVKKELAVS